MNSFIRWLQKHHIIHTWSKWTFYRQEIYSAIMARVGYDDMQRRTCEVCGKTQQELIP